MPLSDNILFEGGIGPVTLKDVYVLGLDHVPKLPKTFWIMMTASGVIGSAFLLLFLMTSVSPQGKWQRIFFLSAASFGFVPYLLTWFHDRYLLFLLPLAMGACALCKPAAASRSNRFLFGAALVTSLFWATFSVATTHDYLSWNRARWQALRHLTEELNVSPREIDGGYEFNGWTNYRYGFRSKPGKSWWWVKEDLYVIALGPLPGYREMGRYPFVRWFPPAEKDDILILRRSSSAAIEEL